MSGRGLQARRADATPDLDTLYCRFISSVMNHHRLERLEQFLAADIVEHAPDDQSVGVEASRRRLTRWLTAFPDLRLVIEDLVSDSDRLMARLTATGTRRGWLVGLAPSRRRLSVPVFEAWSVRDGRCIERWLYVDARAFG